MAQRGRPRKSETTKQTEQQAAKERYLSSNPEVLLINVKEAAWLLRWDDTTVRRYILAEKIPATMNPRNPQDLAEANGTKKGHRSSKVRYRIQKTWIAQRMYGKYINQVLQPMTEEEMSIAINKLNAALKVYEAEQEA